jgi:hypothetical protein
MSSSAFETKKGVEGNVGGDGATACRGTEGRIDTDALRRLVIAWRPSRWNRIAAMAITEDRPDHRLALHPHAEPALATRVIAT